MSTITVSIGEERFIARFQDDLAPRTCAQKIALSVTLFCP